MSLHSTYIATIFITKEKLALIVAIFYGFYLYIVSE